MARANPPVKHMPTAPTPGPPQRSCSSAANARSQSTTGDVRPVASTVNSRLTHVGTNDDSAYRTEPSRPPANGSRPGSPNRWGSTAVQPMSTTRSANSTTLGVMPGISAMTTTAGPVPRRNTARSLPSWVNVVRS